MTLVNLRNHLDKIDGQILKMLSGREAVVRKIAALKQSESRKIFQPGREAKILTTRIGLARKLKLDPDFAVKIFRLILTESKRVQRSLSK